MTLYHEEYVWIANVCDAEAAFLHCNMEVEMFIEWNEGIVDLGIIAKEFMEEYCILLEKSMNGNFDAALLWINLLA